MSTEVRVETVAARTLAAVRREVRIGEVASAWRAALDLVWQFLRTQPGLHAGGHNVFVYQHPASRSAPMIVDFGVEVTRAFDTSGEVRSIESPQGEAAVAVHVGSYDRMRDTHDAVHGWAAAHGRRFAGVSWEVYGDWSDEASKLETTIGYLLAP